MLDREMSGRILIVDDDTKLCALLKDYLEPFGFDVTFAHDGISGLARAQAPDIEAVLLDVMMPGLDGFEVLRRLRSVSDVPVLMLTGRGEETDRIVGLEIGADDYLPKTFSPREMLARLRAALRRAPTRGGAVREKIEPPIEVGDLIVDASTREAKKAGRALTLTPVEFDMLLSLARARGRVRSREQLLRDASQRELDVFDRSVDVHVSALRRKLGDDPKSPRFIQTVRSVGYRMPLPGQEDSI